MYSNSASSCTAFSSTLRRGPRKLRQVLEDLGMTQPMVWAGTFEKEEGTPELQQELEAALRELGAGADLQLWRDTATELLTLARRAEGTLAKRLAKLDGLELTADFLSHERAAKSRKVEKELRFLDAHSLATLPRD